MTQSGYVSDKVGQKFGRWLVVEYADNLNSGRARWKCVCDCGTGRIVSGRSLVDGRSSSCGCLQKEIVRNAHKTHGMSGAKLFDTWRHMIARCTNPDHKFYDRYGGRGILVSEEWMSLEKFVEDNKEFEDSDLTLDRINNDLGYSKENTRWVNMKTQANNRGNSNYVVYLGEKMTVAELAEKVGIKYQTMYHRIVREKQDVEYAIRPVNTIKKEKK